MKIAIAGYGLEGEHNYEYFSKIADEIVIVDEKEKPDRSLPENVKSILGEDAFQKLDDFDIVVRTAGLAPRKIQTNGVIWSATNEFFDKCPAPIIGVTGTKGKGTTSSLIASILRAAGKTVHLVGNIGVSALEELSRIRADDIVVFEMSSFQLWDIQKSPHVAVILGIEPDHLDIHASFDEYVHAKGNIGRFQSADDTIIFNKENEWSKRIAAVSEATHRYEYPFDLDESTISALQIPGKHNQENASAAILAVRGYVDDPKIIEVGLRAFTGLPHRIKFVREFKGVTYYDDSYSSAPAATMAAVNSFSQPEVLILGGYDKQVEFDELAAFLASKPQLKHVVLMGQTRTKLHEALIRHGMSSSTVTICNQTDFTAIIDTARSLADEGDIVLLSPGCASFGMFKNFTDRGNQFVDIVNAL